MMIEKAKSDVSNSISNYREAVLLKIKLAKFKSFY